MKEAFQTWVNNSPVKVCEVFWNPGTKAWDINARGCTDEGETGAWGGTDGVPEGDLDVALGLARDIITGG
jgi:hypothetical protein